MSKMKFPAIFAVTAGLAGTIGLAGIGNAQPAAPSGETIFKQRCAACHSVAAGKPAGVGPNLSGVVGRQAGATAFSYSPALKKANLQWSKANLDRYLAGPAKMIPGTRMSVSLPDAKQRAALVDYLAKAKK